MKSRPYKRHAEAKARTLKASRGLYLWGHDKAGAQFFVFGEPRDQFRPVLEGYASLFLICPSDAAVHWISSPIIVMQQLKSCTIQCSDI